MWFWESETLSLLTNDRSLRGVALFAHKFHRRLLLQHQAGVCIPYHHLGTGRRASVSFCISLDPFWGSSYPLVCLVSSDDHIYLQALTYSIHKWSAGHSESHQRRWNCSDDQEARARVAPIPPSESDSAWPSHPPCDPGTKGGELSI